MVAAGRLSVDEGAQGSRSRAQCADQEYVLEVDEGDNDEARGVAPSRQDEGRHPRKPRSPEKAEARAKD